jgi:hypothetical protein
MKVKQARKLAQKTARKEALKPIKSATTSSVFAEIRARMYAPDVKKYAVKEEVPMKYRVPFFREGNEYYDTSNIFEKINTWLELEDLKHAYASEHARALLEKYGVGAKLLFKAGYSPGDSLKSPSDLSTPLGAVVDRDIYFKRATATVKPMAFLGVYL